MHGAIAKRFRNLSKVQVIRPDILLGGINFELRKIVNDAAAVMRGKKLLKLGASDGKLLADLLHGKLTSDVFQQISDRAAVKQQVIFLTYGLLR